MTRAYRANKVIVTGSRKWVDVDMIRGGLERYRSNFTSVLVHGDCPYGGADKIAAEIATSWGWEVIPVPADWDRLGFMAGPHRNARMCAAHRDAEIVLAFTDEPMAMRGSGTWDCVRCAHDNGIPVLVRSHGRWARR